MSQYGKTVSEVSVPFGESSAADFPTVSEERVRGPKSLVVLKKPLKEKGSIADLIYQQF
jgi:hypothetical protein